jgi:DNA-directed RNA polymerase specialized sigma24 family protein
LEEAATGVSPSRTAKANSDTAQFAKDLAAFVHMTDYQIFLEKQRRDTARREAEERGLDNKKAKSNAPPPPPRRTRRSNARMEPQRHAWVLVRETKLSYQEIAKITGLDIYQVLHMKIQLLRAA